MAREIDAKMRKPATTVKFVCSYGGKILPRRSDGELRYVGGLTRVLAVDRSVSYSELMAKLAEFCGFPATLKCQLPGGDLETLVSVKSDEELLNLMEEYGKRSKQSSSSPLQAPQPLKIRAVLTPPAKELDSVSPRQSSTSSSDFSPYHSPRYCSPLAGASSPIGFHNGAGKLRCYPCYGPGLLPPQPPPRVMHAAAPCCRSHQWLLSHPNGNRIRTI